jgi:hypothetical protein
MGTMRLGVAAVVLAGCSFTPPGSSIDGAVGDGPDAPPDVPSNVTRVCTVRPSAAPLAITTPLGAPPGSSNGNLQSDITCAPGELPIGIGFDTTTNDRPEGGNGGERVAVGIVVQCGTIDLMSDDKFLVTATAVPGFHCNDCSPTWGPLTTAPVVRCPANTTLVGLEGNGGSGTLFNTVKLRCAALTSTGTVGGMTQLLAITDTGGYLNNPQTAACTANEALVSFGLRANCGLDQLTPQCAPLACNP